jgi:hypothetical protein
MAKINDAGKDWIGIDNFCDEILEKYPDAEINIKIGQDHSRVSVNLTPAHSQSKKYEMAGPEFVAILANMYESMKNMDL